MHCFVLLVSSQPMLEKRLVCVIIAWNGRYCCFFFLLPFCRHACNEVVFFFPSLAAKGFITRNSKGLKLKNIHTINTKKFRLGINGGGYEIMYTEGFGGQILK